MHIEVRNPCRQNIGLKFEEEVLHLEHTIVWCWKVDTWQTGTEIPRKFEMRCRRMVEKIIWTDRVRKVEVLHRVTQARVIIHAMKRRKSNWSDHILRRNCLLKHISKGKVEREIKVTWRQRRRRKQLLDNLEETAGYWKQKEGALDCILWRTRLGRG
jgi:hypothetical protein